MEKYKIIVLLTCHENREAIKDVIENILKFNENTCVIINDGTKEGVADLVQKDVFVVTRQPLQKKLLGNEVRINFERFDTMVPLHIQLKDYMLENNLSSEYVVLMSSNQLFIRSGLYDFMLRYKGSYFNRDLDNGCIVSLKRNETFLKYYNEIGQENFKNQTNHDGMFFTYKIFMDMMDYFEDFRYVKLTHHGEEFLYSAYLFKNVDKDNICDFVEYNYWQPTWLNSSDPIKIDELKKCLEGKCFIIKRVSREYNDEVRKYIRELK
jgi:hypothetical protein